MSHDARHKSRTIALIAAGLVLLAAGLWQFRAAYSEGAASEEGKTEHRYTNHLDGETSPYLLMHAHNPVNWYPWGEKAFEKAKKEDKPIFLSVGYSTCYWCQVMERESFTDPDVAKVMNEHFVSIKVDREQRPDIDEQYMLATQLMTRRGGWPNSVWLTPDGKPWMAGTYFPREQFIRTLQRTAELWRTRREDVMKQADRLADAIQRVGSRGMRPGDATSAELSPELLAGAVERYRRSYDEKHGGFGGAPKFPPHGGLRLLLGEYRRTENEALLPLITGTLDAMWLGGVHDHLGGGFHRYSVDAEWLVPHFEKMLYDNAQLMRIYAEAAALTGRERYSRAVAGIYGWLQRKMSGAQGAFYSAIDAEVDGEEGRGYVWRYEEVMEVLGEADGRLFAEVYNVRPGGNYAEEGTREKRGRNILHLPEPIERIAAERGTDPGILRQGLADMRERLLKERLTWEQPEIDDKVLTAWNGLAIEGLAYAGRKLDRPRYTKAAERAANFILEEMRRDGKLLRSYRAGQAEQFGYLDDHAYLAAGLLELYRATGNARWLRPAREIADTILEKFQDPENGGFFFTASEGHEKLLTRSKHLSGGGNVPNANGVAAAVLLRLGRLTGRAKYREAALRTLRSFAGLMQQSPRTMESVLAATSRCYGEAEIGRESVSARERGEGEETRPDARAEAGPVAISAFASHLRVAPGGRFRVAITLDIQEGWHLYGENPEIDFLVPTQVSMEAGAGVEAVALRVPETHRKQDPVLDKPVNSYTGRIWFVQTARVAGEAAPGRRTLSFRIKTQACEADRCLPPETTEMTLDLTVTGKDENGDGPRHPRVFDRFKEQRR